MRSLLVLVCLSACQTWSAADGPGWWEAQPTPVASGSAVPVALASSQAASTDETTDDVRVARAITGWSAALAARDPKRLVHYDDKYGRRVFAYLGTKRQLAEPTVEQIRDASVQHELAEHPPAQWQCSMQRIERMLYFSDPELVNAAAVSRTFADWQRMIDKLWLVRARCLQRDAWLVISGYNTGGAKVLAALLR